MIAGKTLSELSQEIQRQAASKRDFASPVKELRAVGGEIRVGSFGTFPMTPLFNDQLGGYVGIPAKYYDRCQTHAPNLLDAQINRWLQDREDENRTVRTLDGNARALLSGRYRPIDNDLVASAVLPVLSGQDWQVKSSEITETRMYLQVVTPKLSGEIRTGDVVQAGLVISNSEVGLGAFRVEEMLFRLICLNGAIVGRAMQRYHVGRSVGDISEAFESFTDETRRADDRALLMKMRDTIAAAVSEEQFQATLEAVRAGVTRPIVKKLDKAVEDVTHHFGLSEAEGEGVLDFLARGGDLTQWGLANAVTSVANEHEKYDRAIELEKIGGELMLLPEKEFLQLAA